MSDSRNFRDEESEQNESSIKRDIAEEEHTEEVSSFEDLIKPDFDEKLGRYREPDDEDIEAEEQKSREEDEETDYIARLRKDKKLKEYLAIKKSDGDQEDEDTPEQTDDEELIKNEILEAISDECFKGDDEKTKAKKSKAIKEFLNSPKYTTTCEIIDRVLYSYLAGKNYTETGEDEIGNMTIDYLNGKKWDVDKYPNYGWQVMYKFKFNRIPNLLDKYFGRKIEGLTDEEKQERIRDGKSLRKERNEKPYFDRLNKGEFDIDTNNKGLTIEDEENDKHTKNRVVSTAFESEKEEKENARDIKTLGTLMIRCEMAINKSDDEEVKQLWEAIKSSKDIKKINQQAAKIMGKTVKEIQNIKKRLTRYLRKEIPDINFDTFLKEEYEV